MAEHGQLIEEKLVMLPDKPGVYLMRDSRGRVLYVGKAASLRNRVRSYFRSVHRQAPKVQALVQHVADLEFIVTDSPVEALILENNLIKEHRPKYNVNLKDDKTYPYLKINIQHPFPRIVVTRSAAKDGARYFGPYTRAGAVNETLKLLRRLFPLRTCTDHVLEQGKPCLNAHISRCPAPCGGRMDRAVYAGVVREVLLFLEGKGEDLLARLRQRMEEAAEKLEFEEAARLRDQIRAVEDVQASQKMVSTGLEDQDVAAVAREGSLACGQVFFVRGGKVVGREHYFLTGTEGLSREQVMTAFVQQYYARVDLVPREIILDTGVEDQEVLEQWLGAKRGGRVYIRVPRRGDKQKLVEMVHQNALAELQHYQLSRRKEEAMTTGALGELQRALGLAVLPQRIEAYDISNIQGTDTVGSLVVFEGGRPKPSDYRRFKIRTVSGPDDYSAIKEVLLRRFSRSQEADNPAEDGQKGFPLPDLVIIDGGKGQLNAARAVMHRCGAGHIPTFGLAKEEELLFREGDPDPLVLSRESEGLMLLRRLRDEAHRFAVTYHRQLRDLRQQRSLLDEVPGIGPKRKRALLRQFGSVNLMREASLADLAEVEGMDKKTAKVLYDFLQGQK
ncbi:MAG: excinuclease ABC subunit UvrC [Bacillota bacterium]